MKLKSIVTYVFVGAALLIAILVVIVSMRPAHFSVSRSAIMTASPAVVFEQINDLRKWEAWSPWVKLDPNAKMTFSGPTSGTGASCSWAGNREVGEGTMTITESRSNEFIALELRFLKPFEASNTAEFTFKPEGAGTLVAWSMFGTNNFLAKAVGLFIDCEKMVGGQFEEGLARLQAVSETEMKNRSSSPVPTPTP